MSLNTAHINGGVLIHAGECILLFSEHVTLEFNGPQEPAFKGVKKGRIYLTTHRLIFNNKHERDPMQSFSFPFITLSDMELEQPVFGANYIKGKVRAQPNGNWVGEAKFKLQFNHGGAIEFGQAMLKAAHLALGWDVNDEASRQTSPRDPPPPYVPPQSNYYNAPPPAYAPPPQGYYGWVPPTDVFPDQPPADRVFMTDGPPPYPGINGPSAPQGGFPQQGGYPPPGFNSPYQGNAGPAPPHGGYPQPPHGGYPPQPGYPPQHGYPPQSGYPSQGAAGFHSSADAKAAEAAQSAYYDPNRPQMAYVPPPAYYENPPSYDQSMNKKDQ